MQRPIRHHKYSQERLDMLTGVVPKPNRQIQQERWGRANTKALIDLMADFYPFQSQVRHKMPVNFDIDPVQNGKASPLVNPIPFSLANIGRTKKFRSHQRR
jgi:hypothetical protein